MKYISWITAVVAYKVTRKTSDENLKLLHTILFARRGKVSVLFCHSNSHNSKLSITCILLWILISSLDSSSAALMLASNLLIMFMYDSFLMFEQAAQIKQPSYPYVNVCNSIYPHRSIKDDLWHVSNLTPHFLIYVTELILLFFSPTSITFFLALSMTKPRK